MSSACEICDVPAEDVCDRCASVYYCSVDCQRKDWLQHRENCDALIGAETFESVTKWHPALRTTRVGTAKGITAFARLGKALALRIIQTELHDDPPFPLFEFRDVMVGLHSAYYEAATYWAIWFGRRPRRPLSHEQAKQFARLMEDTVDLHIGLSIHAIDRLVQARRQPENVPEDYRKLMLPIDPLASQRARFRVTAEVQNAQRSTIAPANFLAHLLNTVRMPRLAQEVATAWEQNILEYLQVGLIYLRQYAQNPRTARLPMVKLFISDLITGFAQLGAELFDAV